MTPAEQIADTLPPPPLKTCHCGASFDVPAWNALALVGVQDDGDGGELELRNCRCSSTLAVAACASCHGEGVVEGPAICPACEGTRLVPDAAPANCEIEQFGNSPGLGTGGANVDGKRALTSERKKLSALLTFADVTPPPPSDPRPNSPADVGYVPMRGATLHDIRSGSRKWAIPKDAPRRSCTSCASIIFWIVTAAGRKMPIDPDGTSHFATCPNAASHRRARTP